MASVASSLRLRVCLALLAVSALLIGRSAAIPHAHGGGPEEARHASLPPHFHLSWFYDSGPGSPRADQGGRYRHVVTHGDARWSATPGESSLESDAVYLVEVAEPPIRVHAAEFAPHAWLSCRTAADDSSRTAGERPVAAPPFEPDESDLYLSVKRLRI